MVADALSYLASALGIRRLRSPEPAAPKRAAERHRTTDFLAGWRYILRHRGLAALFWNSLVFGGCITAASPLLTVFMLRDRGFEPWQYGVVFGAAGVAGIAGWLLVKPVLGRFGQRRILLAAGVGRNLWQGLIPFASATTGGLLMITASELLLLFFVGLFNPIFAIYG